MASVAMSLVFVIDAGLTFCDTLLAWKYLNKSGPNLKKNKILNNSVPLATDQHFHLQ